MFAFILYPHTYLLHRRITMKNQTGVLSKTELIHALIHNIEENNLYFLKHDENRYDKYRQFLCLRYTDSGEKIGYLDSHEKMQSLEGDIGYWLKEHNIAFNEIDYQAMIDFSMTQTWSQLYWDSDYDPQGFQISRAVIGIPLGTFANIMEDQDVHDALLSYQHGENEQTI